MKEIRLDTIQKEHKGWAAYNFGEQEAWVSLLGMYEEFGEFSSTITEFAMAEEEAKQGKFDRDEFSDGIADLVIFMSGYCTSMRFDLQEIWDMRPNPTRDFVHLVMAFGKVSHHTLKLHQNIRGYEKHHLGIKEALARILAELHGMCEVVQMNLPLITWTTWEQVKKRDWKKNPDNAPSMVMP